MGRAGIRRRKPRHDLPPAAELPPGDADRVFGRFTWGAYSPAGNLERNGFLWRQLGRRHNRDRWTIIGYVVWALVAIPLALGLLYTVVNLFH